MFLASRSAESSLSPYLFLHSPQAVWKRKNRPERMRSTTSWLEKGRGTVGGGKTVSEGSGGVR